MDETMTVGIVGCGNISDIYLQNCQRFPGLALLACADAEPARAEAKAAEFGIRALPVAELLADPAIEIVINLTPPAAHAAVNLAALEAGKHVYTEKPLAIGREEGRRTVELARARGLRVGSAPDTFLGAGLQTCRRLLDAGAIGVPVAATAFMAGHGPESWHPNPEFFYKRGAGPLFDVGPYYLTALISLLGPVARVTGAARISFRSGASPANRTRASSSRSRRPRMSWGCWISPAGLWRRSSPASTCGQRACLTSRFTAPRAR